MSITKHPLQKLLLVLLALCCTGALVMAVAQMLPHRSQSGIAVKEKLTVASATIVKDGNEFSCVLDGELNNPTDDTVTVKALKVTVGDGEKEKELTLSGFSMPPRTNYPISLLWEDGAEWNQIQSVTVEYENGSERIPNVVSRGVAIDGMTVVWLAIAAALGYGVFSVARTLRYMAQEDAIQAAKEE